MTDWNLPPGCTNADVDRAFGGGEGRRGVYTVTVIRTVTSSVSVEVEASSEEDACFDAVIAAQKLSTDKWTTEDDDIEFDTDPDVEGPPERDPDAARDARADYEMDRDR